MSNLPCPECGELNEESAIHCAACGARMDAPLKRQPVPFGELLQANSRNLLWLAAGVIFLALGTYTPWLGSAILGFFLFFTESDRASRSTSSGPSAADAWVLIGMAGICFLTGGIGLYLSLRQFWAKRLGAE